MTPRRISRSRRRLCSRHVSTSGAGSVATARPRTLAASCASGRTGQPVGVADLLGARRLALPQRLVGLGIGQVERERRAVVDRDRAPQRQPEQIEEVAAGAERIQVRRVVARARDAGRDQRRAIAQASRPAARGALHALRVVGTSGQHADRQYSAPAPCSSLLAARREEAEAAWRSRRLRARRVWGSGGSAGGAAPGSAAPRSFRDRASPAPRGRWARAGARSARRGRGRAPGTARVPKKSCRRDSIQGVSPTS